MVESKRGKKHTDRKDRGREKYQNGQREKEGTCKSEIKGLGLSGSGLKKTEVDSRLPVLVFGAPAFN